MYYYGMLQTDHNGFSTKRFGSKKDRVSEQFTVLHNEVLCD